MSAEGGARWAEAWKPLLPFFAGLGIALAAAVIAPGLGAKGGLLRTEHLTGPAVMGIFLIQGLQLPAEQVRRGLGAWRVHLFCQVWMFGVAPALAWGVAAALGGALGPGERIGLLYLGMLPTTVATNAAFSARAGGNTAVAMFNIVVGNLLGVLIGPAWLAFLLASGTGAAIDVWPLVRAIFMQLIVPFAVGQLLRHWLAAWADRRKPVLRDAASCLIFFIVYSSICNFLAGPARGGGAGMAWAAGAALGFLVVNKALCWWALARLGWAHEFRVAAFFSASQKTLAAGLPIAGAVYGAAGGVPGLPPMAALVLPLIVFHIGQLVLGALLVPVVGRTALRD